MVAGFEKFKEHFGAFQDEFIIIGGTAVQLVRGASEHARVTRDIDLLVVAERMSSDFRRRFMHFFRRVGIHAISPKTASRTSIDSSSRRQRDIPR